MKLYELLANVDSPDLQVEYDGNGDILYIGFPPEHNATDSEGWVFKLTWSSDGVTRVEKLEGAWDNRATLNWV